MSEHVRLGRGVRVPAFSVDSVVRAVVKGLASSSRKATELLTEAFLFF
jgi:hypothetical protein